MTLHMNYRKCNCLKQLALFLPYETDVVITRRFIFKFLTGSAVSSFIGHIIVLSGHWVIVRQCLIDIDIWHLASGLFLATSWKSHWPINQNCRWIRSVILAMFTFLNWACQTGSNSALGRNPTTVGWLVGWWGFTGWDDYEDHYRNVKSTWGSGGRIA